MSLHLGDIAPDFTADTTDGEISFIVVPNASNDISGPIIANVCNFSKPTEGQPALLSLDEAGTLGG